jgi:hypothetical protein
MNHADYRHLRLSQALARDALRQLSKDFAELPARRWCSRAGADRRGGGARLLEPFRADRHVAHEVLCAQRILSLRDAAQPAEHVADALPHSEEAGLYHTIRLFAGGTPRAAGCDGDAGAPRWIGLAPSPRTSSARKWANCPPPRNTVGDNF